MIEKAYRELRGDNYDQKELDDAKSRMQWTVIDGVVYDITNFIDKHPGGKHTIVRGIGKDSTKMFFDSHPGLEIESS